MIALVLLAYLYAPTHVEVCRATVFGFDGDEFAGAPSSRAMWPRTVQPHHPGYAHRTLPDWTPATICTPWPWKCTTGVKLDAGPMGADYRGHWVIKRSGRDPGAWRGCVDLLPRLARDLGALPALDGRWAWSGQIMLFAWPQKAERFRGLVR